MAYSRSYPSDFFVLNETGGGALGPYLLVNEEWICLGEGFPSCRGYLVSLIRLDGSVSEISM